MKLHPKTSWRVTHACSCSPVTTLPVTKEITEERKVILRLRGIRGPECLLQVQKCISAVEGVKAVTVDAELLSVELSEEVLIRDLVEEVRKLEAGYRAVPYVSHAWTWRGHSIHYGVAGPEDGPAVLLVHGFGGNVNHYRKLIADLQPMYRVYAVDLLGFGESDKPASVEYDPHL